SVVAWAWSFGDGSSDNNGPTVSHVFADSGMYTVTLTVTDNAGGSHSTTQTIVVNSANITPVAEATSAPGTLDANFDATGSSALSGSLVSWEWDLGDGTSSNGEEVSYTYAQAGEYEYTLTVTDSAGGQAFATGSILVNDIVIERVSDGLVALYELNEGGGAVVGDTAGQGIPLNLNILDTNEVTWIPGGLRVDTSAEIRSPGPASKLIDAARANNAFTMEAWLKTADLTQNGPARVVSISENSSSRNLTLGQGVYNNGGDRIEVRARTSDTSNNGQPSTATEQGSLTTDLQHVVFTIDDQGNTTIFIDGVQRASEEIGGDLSNWDTDHVLSLANEASGDRPWLGELHLVAFYDRALPYSEVTQNFAAGAEGEGLGYDLAPIVVVESDRLAGVMPLLVNFDGSNSFDIDGVIVSHAWDFGDGNSAATANAQHTYTTPGEFTATLTVTDNFGNSRSSSVEINVIDPANIPEIVVYDWNKPVTTAQRGFANINNPTGDANGDWTFPIDYRDGTFHIRAEVRSQPVPQSMHVQFCIWQYNLTRETCTSTEPIEGQPGTVMTTSQTIASMWKKGGKALDWDQPRQRYGMPVKDAQKQPVSDFLNWNWQGYDPDDWYPLDIRYTVVLVAPGATFSGWENYVD
ncbi:MAG: PKD domain-containing protein, partial [Pseudomonadota bacterium]